MDSHAPKERLLPHQGPLSARHFHNIAKGALSKHDSEQEQDHDGPDVYEDLGSSDKFSCQQHI